MLETRTGKPLSCESSEAARLYQEAVDLILGSESGAAEALDKALELAPGFALAAAARYYAAQTLATLTPGARVGIGGSNVERVLVDLLEARCKTLH